jgi:diguanylate cyclase (GGDEF)-like protein/PAS domain S-box-containing protein
LKRRYLAAPATLSTPAALGAMDGPAKLGETAKLILDAAGDGIYGIDKDGITTFANPATEAMTGWKAEELLGKSQHSMIHHSHADGSVYPRETCPVHQALLDGRVHHCDSEVFWKKDGTSFPVAYTSTPILQAGEPVGAVVLFQDISGKKRRENWERDKNSIFAAIAGHADLDAVLALIANAFAGLHPCLSIALFARAGSTMQLLAQAGDRARIEQAFVSGAGAGTQSTSILAGGGDDEMIPCPCAEGQERVGNFVDSDLCLRRQLLSASGEVLGSIAIFAAHRDGLDQPARESAKRVCHLARLAIEHQQLHTALLRQSRHDHLTGLPNRLLLEDRLEQAIAEARRAKKQVGVCYLDLDRFKQINDTLGHSIGDLFLQHVARLLESSVREIDTVARHGGDEFIVLLANLASDAEAPEACGRILRKLREPIMIGEHRIAATASIGISVYPAGGDNASLLLRNADTALYVAKRSGKDRAERYESWQGKRLQRNAALQMAMPSAIDEKQFSLAYQPLYSASRELKGFEALLRWSHPELGNVGPSDFVPIAEETGLIVVLGAWVLNEACRQAQAWNLSSAIPVRIFVNVSGVQLCRPEFADTVSRALARSGLDPKLLELEVTESWIMTDVAAASDRLGRIRDLGVGIGIDDFGTGQSSFACLQQLPADTIKIDQSFISRLDGSIKNSAIVRTIVALASHLNLQTVAEGVETELQFQEIQAMGCNLVQGYLLSRPLSAQAAGLLVPRGILPLAHAVEPVVGSSA